MTKSIRTKSSKVDLKNNQKWCPFARNLSIFNTAYNRDFGYYDGTCACITRYCAVWITTDEETDSGRCGLIKHSG